MNESVKVLADFVLVKQTMRKKKTKILLDSAKDDREKFDFSFEIVQLGDKVTRDIKVGEHPIFSEYVKFSGLKVIEKDNTEMVTLVIVHENDIIAIDYEPMNLDKDNNSTSDINLSKN